MPDDYEFLEIVSRVRRIERRLDALLAHHGIALDHDDNAEPAALKSTRGFNGECHVDMIGEKLRSWWRKRQLRKRRRRYSEHGEVGS